MDARHSQPGTIKHCPAAAIVCLPTYELKSISRAVWRECKHVGSRHSENSTVLNRSICSLLELLLTVSQQRQPIHVKWS